MQLKTLSVSILATLSLLSFESKSQDLKDDAIKKVIRTETQSYFKKDADTWQGTWVQDGMSMRTYVGSLGYYTVTGWDKFGPQEVKSLKENPAPDSSEVTTDSFTIRKDGNIAVVDYKQLIRFPNLPEPFDKVSSEEHRVMLKKDGKWKIASAVTTDLTGYGKSGKELTINSIGYGYLQSGKTDDAIKIFELNTKLFPDSWNAFDSLGEGYAKAGNKDLAIQNYEKSIQLNPKNESGKQALAKLKQ